MTIPRVSILAAFTVTIAAAAYTYYYTDTLTSIDATKWTQNGTLTASSSGLTSSDSNGGSLISSIAVPGGAGQGEVKMALNLTASGGTYVMYLDASSNAMSGPASRGSYYAFEIQNPTFTGNLCSATLAGYKSVAGSVTLLFTASVPCYNGIVYHAASGEAGAHVLYADNVYYGYFADGDLVSGQPGIGVRGAPAGNSVSRVDLGPIDTVAPPAVNAQSIAVSPFPNYVDVRWPGAVDDPNGIGVWGYQMYRDGQYIALKNSNLFTDETLQPNTTYHYSVYVMDWHNNWSPATNFTVVTPPAGSIDPRRIGVRSTGSYWGAAGEQVDTRSGNLNFSVPLVKTQARRGAGINFSLSYNSQNWRQDQGGTWSLGEDVGYGYGWQLLAGSLEPSYSYYWALDHYTFTDAAGSRYRLNINTNGVWTSTDGTYVTYDSNTQRLYFPDGSFWLMGCVSGGAEADAGTLYPTVFEDSNGNQITAQYTPGLNTGWVNSSARLAFIRDVRCQNASADGNTCYDSYPTYSFGYNSDPTPHLTSISNSINTAEGYTFSYIGNQALTSPFSPPVSFGTTTVLQSLTVAGLNISHNFQYSSTSAEMTQVTTPLGGVLQWQYRTFTYPGSVSLREVQNRYMQPLSGGSTYSWSFSHDDAGDASRAVHYWTVVLDNGTQTEKVWWFRFDSGAYIGLTSAYEERDPGQVGLLHKDYVWGQDSAGTPYVNRVQTILNQGTNQVTSNAYQTLDTYGNITQSQIYDYGSNSATRTYNYTYLHQVDSHYAPLYIRNRLVSATVTDASGVKTLVSNLYDGIPYIGFMNYTCSYISYTTGSTWLHDTSYGTNFACRGNLAQTIALGDTKSQNSFSYDSDGVMRQTTNGAGQTVTATPAASTTGSLPGVLTPNGNSNLQTTVSYVASFAVTSVTGANNAQANTTYDAYGRPQQSQIPDGAQTTYTYNYNPNWQKATLGNRWKKTTLDGFGRTTRVETGHDQTTISTVDTQYGPCACSPLGKMSAVSQPYAPGATPVWTTYAYDGCGRTLTVTAPDGASKTTYAYQGNNTTVTDAAGKWKTQTTDAFGNLVTVTEPNPAGGNFAANYTYNSVNQLTQVSMPRSNGTQTRTFQYTGTDLTSATNPENGTVTYVYDGAHHVTSRTDAKGQVTQSDYDAYGRPSEVRHGTMQNGVFTEDTSQRMDYTYDTGQNGQGRLTGVQFGGRDGPGRSYSRTFTYGYSYNQAGRVTTQTMSTLMFTGQLYPSTVPLNLTATYLWDNEGKMTSKAYPSLQAQGSAYWNITGWTGPVFAYQFDSMARVNGMTEDDGQGPSSVASVSQYGPSGELLSFSYDGFSQTQTYNSMLQLTRMTVAGFMDMQYVYSGTQNNGRITQSIDGITGENVSYAYDALNRLIAASTADNTWGNAYTYDGFGNLTGKTVTKGSAPSLAVVYDIYNHQQAVSYDANGNPPGVWDGENRMVGQGNWEYAYDPWGKRVEKNTVTDPNYSNNSWEFYFYGITGERLATVACVFDYGPQQGPDCQAHVGDVSFVGKRMRSNGKTVVTDRLGSVRATYWSGQSTSMSYFPYGEERTLTADGVEKFGTYFRDGAGQDYADQRYYSNVVGRFLGPDPRRMTVVNRRNPLSWNLYTYSLDDPINNSDPTGTTCIPVNGLWANDGTGCGYVGQPVSQYGSFNFASNGSSSVTTTITIYCAPGTAGADCQDTAIYGWLGLGQQVVQAVGQQLSSISVGGFFFQPLGSGSLGPAEGSVLLVTALDSNSGKSTSALAEVGVGEVAVGYEQGLNNNSSDVLVLSGLTPGNATGLDIGFLGGPNSGTFGFYFGLGDWGFGGYFSLGGDPDRNLFMTPDTPDPATSNQ